MICADSAHGREELRALACVWTANGKTAGLRIAAHTECLAQCLLQHRQIRNGAARG